MIKQYEIRFRCELLTPLFMGDAKQKTELRPTSIKGALRFWWRAMHSHLPLLDKQGTIGLKTLEGRVWGDTERRSPLAIRLGEVHLSPAVFFDEFNESEGLKYLFHFVLDGEKKRAGFNFIGDDKEVAWFELIITSREKELLKDAACSLWLLGHFGGLGTRARRGGGDLYVTVKEDSEKIVESLGLSFDSSAPGMLFKNYILHNYGYCARYFLKRTETLEKPESRETGMRKTSYSNISELKLYYRKYSKEENSKGQDTYPPLELLGRMGINYKTHRNNVYAREGSLKALSIMGLPFARDGKMVSPVHFQRRASPLVIRIIKFKEQYFGCVIILQGIFLPEGKEGIS